MDYTIVGGGALGALLAHRLHTRGLEVRVIEPDAERRRVLASGYPVTGYFDAPAAPVAVGAWDDVGPTPRALFLCVPPAHTATALAQARAAFAETPLVTFVAGVAHLEEVRGWRAEVIHAVSNVEVRLDGAGHPETGFHNFTWLGNPAATETELMRAVQRDLAWLGPTLTSKVIEGLVWSKAVFHVEAALPVLFGQGARAFYDDGDRIAIAAELVREALAVAAAAGATPQAFDFFDPNLYATRTAGERSTLEAWVRHCWQRHEQFRVGVDAAFTEPAGLGWSLDPANAESCFPDVLAGLIERGRAHGVATPGLARLTNLHLEARAAGRPIALERITELGREGAA